MCDDEEKDPEVTEAELVGEEVPTNVLSCGHIDGFEHRMANAILDLVQDFVRARQDPTDALMALITETFEVLGYAIPTLEQIRAIGERIREEKIKGDININ